MPPVVSIDRNQVTNLGDLCKSMPSVCQGYFTPYFTELFNMSSKYFAAVHASEEFDRLRLTAKIPSSLNSIKTPTLQVSAEFRNGGGHHPIYSGIDGQVRKFRQQLVQTFKEAKLEEVAFFRENYIDESVMTAHIKKILVSMAAKVCETHAVADIYKLPPQMSEILKLWENGEALSWARQVIELARLKNLAGYEKVSRKRKAKADVDIEMTGTSAGDVDVRSIEKTVARVLARKEQSRRDKRSRTKGNILFSEASTHELALFDSENRRERNQRKASPRFGFFERTEKEISEMMILKRRTFSLTNLDSYPKSFFTSSLEARKLFIMSQLSKETLQSLRFLNFDVHKAPGVRLPRNIEYFLAVNLKYLFPQITEFSLPITSYEGLSNDIRRRIHQQNKEPVYSLPYWMGVKMPERNYPSSTDNVEGGILMGRDRMLSMLSHVRPFRVNHAEPEKFLTELSCSKQDLQEYLSLNRYMTFITDKNLGLSVVENDWYRREINNHLSLDCYQEIRSEQGVPWDHIRRQTAELGNMESIPEAIQGFLEASPKLIALPEFHGIPKIHKNPWKIRPIVPMHSYYTSHLAMVIHYYLLPLMDRLPWICHSSKDFVRDILLASEGKTGLRLHSGDVVSMYTNILTENLVPAVKAVLTHFQCPAPLCDWIGETISFLNNNVYFKFGRRIFKQTKGIAMGLACGPSLANIFMAAWEWHHKIYERIPFYRRYIDDVFVLSYDETLDPDLLQVPGLDIEWVSDERIPFLDCLVHRHGESICVKPYTKPLSHYQYVPWNSAHPIHVKRGLVKTELLRFSRLSAQKHYFDEVKTKLFIVLRARGYPRSVLKAWMRQVQWRDPRVLPPLALREDQLRPLQVKSQYNPIWAHLPLDSLWDEITRDMAHAGSFDEHQIPMVHTLRKSLKRTMNLWDVVRRVNKNIQREAQTEESGGQRNHSDMDHDTLVLL